MTSIRTAVLGTLIVVAACATTPDFREVTDADQPVVRRGYSILPPGGGHWVMHTGTPPEMAVFGKVDREHFRSKGSVVLSAIGMQARKHDIATGDGLQAEVRDFVRGPGGDRITVVNEALEVYRDDTLATDCVRIAAIFEERDNPRLQGEVLAMPMWGKACRHPQVKGYLVMVSYSERRPVAVPPLMTDALRAECERSVKSLKLLPVQ